MLRASDSDEEKSLFQQLRYSYPDERVMRRFEIPTHHACGKFAPEIAFIVQQNDDADRDCFGQCAVSTLQVGGGVGEGVGDYIAVFAELFAEPELD